MLNLLEDKLIRIKTDDVVVRSSLPGLYELMMKDKVLAFSSLRPHQRHPWHAFLAQLGALALVKAGESDIPTRSDSWRNLIGNLTPNCPDDGPWHLVINEIASPAFMQPPASSESGRDDYKKQCRTPDELDMLVTAKNHDLKSSSAVGGDVDDWLFALVTLQTAQGFSGSGNFGISRMNGGFGNRPSLSITPSERPGLHLKRDILALLEQRSAILNEYDMADGGLSLLWCIPWDGTKGEALPLSKLDPFFIEICRRVRMGMDADRRLACIKATSQAARINAKSLNGNIGDPWTPIDRKGPKSLTLGVGGFHYRRLTDYLFSNNWKHPPLLRPRESERNLACTLLLARALVRGQGKTEGYYERVIPFRRRVTRSFGRPSREIGDIAADCIGELATIQRILHHAISVFAAGGKTEGISGEHRDRARLWVNRLDSFVDSRFFERLQDELEADSPEKRLQVRKSWMLEVKDMAQKLLQQATEALPCSTMQRYRARASAESLFQGRIRGPKGLPAYFMDTEDEHDERATEQ